MTGRLSFSRLTLASLALSFLVGSAASSATTSDAERDAKAREYFTNTELVNQNGERVRFYDDVLKDKVVVINFIFTNCQGACPLMTRNLTNIRDMLPESERDQVHFISISLDPVRDTPAAMKEFAKTHQADQAGWQFLTGRPENVTFVTKRLGSYTDNLEVHSTLLLAADVQNAYWTKIPPNVPPPGVVERLRQLVKDDLAP